MLRRTAQRLKIKTQIRRTWTFQASKGFAVQDRCTSPVAPLQMQLRDSNLQDSLQAAPLWISRFVPELLKHIMGGVPLPCVEELQGLMKAGVRLRH